MEAMEETRRIYGTRNALKLWTQKEKALEGASAFVVVTEWSAFRSLDFDLVKKSLTSPVVFDG